MHFSFCLHAILTHILALVPGTTPLTLCGRAGPIGHRLGKKTGRINAANEDPMIGDGLAVAMRGATNLIGTGTGNETETETEDTAIATTTGTAIAIEIETTRETVVDAGVKTTVMTQQRIATRGNVERRVQTRHLFSLFLGIVHAGALRGLIPGIIMVIDVLGILVIPETNSMTRPGTEGIVGVAATSAALALKMIPLNASRLRLR
jgi:hypothetical protein